MYNTFISVVSLLVPDEGYISRYLQNVHNVLKENFSYYEIILINNGLDTDLVKKATVSLAEDLKKNITILNLSKHTHKDNAVIAGLDRANGDYTVIFDMNLYEKADLIVELYKKTQDNFDIVHLQYRKRKLSFHKLIFFKEFYSIMKKYSEIDINANVHNCRIISRRALNSITKVRERHLYLKGIFSLVGYNTTAIEADIPEEKVHDKFEPYLFQSPNPSIKQAMGAIISFTNFLRRLLFISFLIAILFSLFATLDALLIKLTGKDIFGQIQVNTDVEYLIVLVSFMFSILFFILYLFNIYLSNINREIKQRPEYFIKSIQRID